MMQLAKQEQLAKFQPFLKTSIFWTLEATLKEHRCKFKIHKITYSISEPRIQYGVHKNKALLYP